MKIDLIGQTFGRLTVIGIARHAKHGLSTKWRCKCECGNVVDVVTNHLKSGHTKSCGCLTMRYGKANGSGRELHGMAKTRIYGVWSAMRDRVYNPTSKYYHRYGGRGITIAEEWDSFIAFRDWSYEHGYKDGLEIDRIDNNKGYSPENCRWVTHAINLQNTHRKQEAIVNGTPIPLAELAKKYGVLYRRVYQMHKRGKNGDEIASKLAKEMSAR